MPIEPTQYEVAPIEEVRSINPDMIRLARESRGMTLPEMARHLMIPTRRASDIEMGGCTIDNNLLEAIVNLLGYPKAFYFQRFEIYPVRICRNVGGF